MALLLAGGTAGFKHMLSIFSTASIMHIRSALVSWGLGRFYSIRVVFQKNSVAPKPRHRAPRQLFKKWTSLLSHHHSEIYRSV